MWFYYQKRQLPLPSLQAVLVLSFPFLHSVLSLMAPAETNKQIERSGTCSYWCRAASCLCFPCRVTWFNEKQFNKKSSVITGNTIYCSGNIVLLVCIPQPKQNPFVDMLQEKKVQFTLTKVWILNFFPKEATLLALCASVKHIKIIFSPFQSGRQRSMHEMMNKCGMLVNATRNIWRLSESFKYFFQINDMKKANKQLQTA